MKHSFTKGVIQHCTQKTTPAPELYKNYVSSYLERDLRYFTQVGDLSTFKKFMGICAARIGQLLNLTSLARDCGISDATAKRWLSILEASYIVYLLQPYHNNLGKRLIKTPKLYFYDTGLACSLLGIKEKEISLHPLRGSLFEALIISEIIKWHLNHDEIPDIYFWRDSHGHEVDCIIKREVISLYPSKSKQAILQALISLILSTTGVSCTNNQRLCDICRSILRYPSLRKPSELAIDRYVFEKDRMKKKNRSVMRRSFLMRSIYSYLERMLFINSDVRSIRCVL